MTDPLSILAGPILAPLVTKLFPDRIGVEYVMAARERRQTWNAVAANLLLNEALCPADSLNLAKLGDHMLHTNRHILLTESYGKVPRGLVNCLAKLGPVGLAPEIYKRLFDILEHGGAQARRLWHATSISVSDLETLHRLLAFSGEMVLSACMKESEARFLHWLLAQPHMAMQNKFFARSEWPMKPFFHDAYGLDRDDTHFFRYMWKLLHSNTWQFPEPPWAGSTLLRPIRNSKAMRELGVEMRNCLRHHIKFALAGNDAYYVWRETELAVLQIKRLVPWGWVLWGAAGRDNGDISKETFQRIGAELSSVRCIFSAWDYNSKPNTSKCLDIPRFVPALEDAFAVNLV